jgi:uncharacterized membrane protein YfcA
MLMPDPVTLLIVCPLIFLGSFVDAIAGGGGLITVPAYLLAGIPPHVAIGTNKLSSSLGMVISTSRLYLGGFIDLRLVLVPIVCAFGGSLVGARIALLVPPDVFRILLVILLPIVAVAVLRKRTVGDGEDMDIHRRRRLMGLVALCCGTYDGFYGPGGGTFMLLGFAAIAKLDVRAAAGQMKMANFASGLAALATFGLAGQVDWMLGLIAGLFGIAGHWFGSGLVLKNGSRIVRPIIIVVLALLFVKTAWDFLAK